MQIQRRTVLTKIQTELVKGQRFNKKLNPLLQTIEEADLNHQQGKNKKRINKINQMK